MQASWRFPGGRDGLAIALSFGAIAATAVAFLDPSFANPSDWSVQNGRLNTGNAALLAAFGVLLLRTRPGLGYLFLATASWAIAGAIESAWWDSLSVAQFSDVPTPANPAFPLIGLAVLARTAVPAAILTLYATEPRRRLGAWVAVVGWGVTIASLVGALLRVVREVDQSAGRETWTVWNELSYQVDQPIPLLAIALLGFLGSIRAAALAHESQESEGDRAGGEARVGPSRMLLGAIVGAALVYVPAMLAFLNRAPGFDDPDSSGRVLAIPILAALIAVVAERWSRIVAWASVGVTFVSIAFLVLDRAAADYVVYALSLPEGSDIPTPVAFVVFLAAAGGLVVLAFAATSIALRAAWDESADPAHAGRAGDLADRSWAVRGALGGLVVLGWSTAGVLMGAGFPTLIGAGFVPLFVVALAVAVAGWRRLVPAVAEAERVATNPVRPLRYLEIVISEALTRTAEHRRRAVDAERARLGSELNQLQDAIRSMLTDGRLVLEPAPSGAAMRNAAGVARPTSDLRRPSDREIEVINLLATGASNEEIARDLVLSLKTVESHLRRLFSRYDVTNRTELAVLAVREGWVDAP